MNSYYRQILAAAKDSFNNGPLGNSLHSAHGPDHWQRVHTAAVLLAANTEGADVDVVRHFALLHDCKRENEYDDPDHGYRAAQYAKELHASGAINLTDDQMHLLCLACLEHDCGNTTMCPTVGCCWDADRLDLGRVFITPSPEFLSTAAGRGAAALLSVH